ncbi:hypothetical protein BOTCAL_0352g00010 [Botryotinia calthae]|uniref:DUF7025 domain-containing protein n=1 Tax=Botryotinia calthae TaxID=38488 RepID=A0A4Y8CSE5_9HELO|nr:hypothetical protein BOTCAL_0352g00010 [Botryotinia calthae]
MENSEIEDTPSAKRAADSMPTPISEPDVQLTIAEEDPLFDLTIFNGDFKLDEENHQPEPDPSLTIFEVIVKAQGYVEPLRGANPNEMNEAHGKDLVKIEKINEARIHIHSQSLIEVIREVVGYYPSQSLDDRLVIIQKPYWVLIHHEKELHEKHTRLTEQPEFIEADKEKAEHLKALLDFIKPQSMKLLQPILPLLKNKVSTVSFDGLRYLLKPGTLAYYKYDNEWIGCIILRVNSEVKRKSFKITNWNVSVWYLEWSYHAYRIESKFDIESFEGERDITSLKVIPREYWDANDNNARRKKFED